MSVDIEQATVSYKQVCDKNGFCVVKIIPQMQNIEEQKSEEKVELKNEKVEEKSDKVEAKGTMKLSSSRKNKKR